MKSTLKFLALGASLVFVGAAPALAADIVGLITKTETNPFFVKMREGAQAKAKELGIELRSAAGKYDGDNDGQVAAIENLISAGAKGFAIVPSDSKAIVPTIKISHTRRRIASASSIAATSAKAIGRIWC